MSVLTKGGDMYCPNCGVGCGSMNGEPWHASAELFCDCGWCGDYSDLEDTKAVQMESVMAPSVLRVI